MVYNFSLQYLFNVYKVYFLNLVIQLVFIMLIQRNKTRKKEKNRKNHITTQ